MRLLLVTIFVLISFNTYSSIPRCMYSFQGWFQNPGSLSPFSKKQSKVFKNKGVKEITQTDNNSKSIYQIDKSGLVKSIKVFNFKKGKEILFYEAFYLYNDSNQIVSVKGTGQHNVTFVSLRYDVLGRIIYYKTTDRPKPKTKKKYIAYNYSDTYILKESNRYYVTLTDSSSTSTEVRLNNANELILRSNNNRIDSIYIESHNDSVLLKKYFYKEQKDSSFRIGKIKTFHNHQIQEIKTYRTNSNDTTDIDYKIYTYDNLKLIRVENLPNYYHRNDMTLYTYHQCKCQNLKYDGFLKREGLLQKEISLHFRDNKMTEYIDNYEYKFY